MEDFPYWERSTIQRPKCLNALQMQAYSEAAKGWHQRRGLYVRSQGSVEDENFMAREIA